MKWFLWDEFLCEVQLARVKLREIDDEVICNLIEDSSKFFAQFVVVVSINYCQTCIIQCRKQDFTDPEFELTIGSRVDVQG